MFNAIIRVTINKYYETYTNIYQPISISQIQYLSPAQNKRQKPVFVHIFAFVGFYKIRNDDK